LDTTWAVEDAPSTYTYRDYGKGDPETFSPEYYRGKKIDPNYAPYYGLVNSGIPAPSARMIIAYRNKGGTYSTMHDLLKFDGIDSSLLAGMKDILVFNPDLHKGGINRADPKRNSFITLELNSSDTAELIMLPGIGPVLSARIIKYRTALGGYYSTDQLIEVYGITDSLQNILEMHLTVDTLLIRKINLNTVSAEELLKHPYLNRYQAKAILGYRRLAGPFGRVEELIENYLIPDENFLKLKPYLAAN